MSTQYEEILQSISKVNKLINVLSVQTHVHTMINHMMAAHAVVDNYLDEMARKYEALESSVIGRGTILDLIPLKQIHEVLQNATDRLPADFLCASHSRGQS